MATSVSGVTGTSSTDGYSGLAVAGGTELGKDDFLKLLVAQIKNQNPLNPADGVEFLAQLAQFSQLEQLINIRTGVESLVTSSTGDATSESTTGGTEATTED